MQLHHFLYISKTYEKNGSMKLQVEAEMWPQLHKDLQPRGQRLRNKHRRNCHTMPTKPTPISLLISSALLILYTVNSPLIAPVAQASLVIPSNNQATSRFASNSSAVSTHLHLSSSPSISSSLQNSPPSSSTSGHPSGSNSAKFEQPNSPIRGLVKLSNSNSTTRSLINHDHSSNGHIHKNSNLFSDLISSHRSTINGSDISSQKRSKLVNERTCIGTSQRMSALVNKTEHYHSLAERYRNCTYVIGNLEITWLEKTKDGKPLDLSFLHNIREITGYLLIAYVQVERIRMPNLQIIRGRDVFRLNTEQKEEYAMFLIENELKNLELPNLREIIVGSVGSYNNRNLCHLRRISWDEILNTGYKSLFVFNGTEPECPSCDPACLGDRCWGEGPEMCQKFSKIGCPDQCSQGRCFGTGPRECCHLFCAGGCTGPKQTDCLACRNFYDDGECIQECPPIQKYNTGKFLWEADPKGKYAFGATCVTECPEHLLRDHGACVRNCPPTKRAINNECVPCAGPCPKNCQGVDVVHSGNIDQFINCTQIEGSLTILDTTFEGFAEVYPNNTMGLRYKPLDPSRLDVFKTIKEITGYLNVQASHPAFKNLSCFKNLEVIGGRQTTDLFYALSIIKTSLVSLGLHSLRKVRSGKIIIEENKDLCLSDSMDWSYLNITSLDSITTRGNADARKCRSLGIHCHDQCTKSGCWGPGPDECLTCNNFKLENYCVEDCSSTESVGFLSFQSSSSDKTCKKCHSECRGGCTGPNANDCFECKSVKDGNFCVSKCPSHKYNRNGICEECNKGCSEGCTGPLNKVGEGGCDACQKTVISSPGSNYSMHCIKTTDNCPEGYYEEYVVQKPEGPSSSQVGKPICRRCHHRCKSCTGMGSHVSVCECAKYLVGEQCEETCPRDYYTDDKTRQCVRCSPECNGCFGPTEADCIACRVYRIYPGSFTPSNISVSQYKDDGVFVQLDQVKFNCTAQCPPDKPHKISNPNMLDPYCSMNPDSNSEGFGLGYASMFFIFVLIFSSVAAIFLALYRCQMEKHKTRKLTARLSGFDDDEPLNQSNLKPNLAPLRSIKETELRRGKILGVGFGGTVYQGLWLPEGQQKGARPVAIKILRDNGETNMNKELLDEAYIMASVNHPNLVRLLAICATPDHLMLITQLMPLGCLLEYVKTHKNDIGSKNLLEWCKQIARGMAYLEERRMVHRDLALRNVLLQTSGRALISDFGLAKFLDDQSEYHSGGGRLPIKWLAPECINERKFTHKSDVWAFGVTIWELLTFGMKPFEEYETKDVPRAIEKGARLHQPNYMSAEVYKVMYACWFHRPDDRPNFNNLMDNFTNFARDPERYLICKSKGIEYGSNKEPGPNSDSDENVFEDCPSELNGYLDEVHSRNVFNDNMSSNHLIPNEFISYELRNQSESDSAGLGQQPLTPTSKRMGMIGSSRQQSIEEEIFGMGVQNNRGSKTSMDSNNNSSFINNERLINMDGWSSHHTVSTNSVGQRSELPTDGDDYLLPSPSTNEEKFSKFLASRDGNCSRKNPPVSSFARDPPHSAGLIGISNDEYFLTRMNYVNQTGQGPHGANNASSGHIPQSLV